MTDRVLLGFEVGTGERVEIPIAHTFVTGQTQLSGKTTTLRAIVERSQRRALAFVTKRGEVLPGRRIPPYLPREGEQAIHWRLVETILASALGQRNMKWERIWLINAVKRPKVAKSLQDVHQNVRALQAKASGKTAETYELIAEYLDLVLPEMRELAAADRLELHDGLNVMDLAGVGQQLQALVIRASLEHINAHESDVLTVLPEAWEFAPRQTNTPAKDQVIAMARKGAAPKVRNYLLVDSQDIAGVDTVVRQACSVWVIGVQRELNELGRALKQIHGIKRPKLDDVAQLEVGEFFACWGRHAVKTYVMPSGVSELEAREYALGQRAIRPRPPTAPPLTVEMKRRPTAMTEATLTDFAARGLRAQKAVDVIIDAHNRKAKGSEDDVNPAQEKKLDVALDGITRLVKAFEHGITVEVPAPPPLAKDGPVPRAAADMPDRELEDLYQQIRRRLLEDVASDPQILEVLVRQPEIRVKVERHTIEVDGDTLQGRLALLLHEGFLDQAKEAGTIFAELQRRGFKTAFPNVSKELQELARMGFVTRSNKWYTAVPAMKSNIVAETL